MSGFFYAIVLTLNAATGATEAVEINTAVPFDAPTCRLIAETNDKAQAPAGRVFKTLCLHPADAMRFMAHQDPELIVR